VSPAFGAPQRDFFLITFGERVEVLAGINRIIIISFYPVSFIVTIKWLIEANPRNIYVASAAGHNTFFSLLDQLSLFLS